MLTHVHKATIKSIYVDALIFVDLLSVKSDLCFRHDSAPGVKSNSTDHSKLVVINTCQNTEAKQTNIHTCSIKTMNKYME